VHPDNGEERQCRVGQRGTYHHALLPYAQRPSFVVRIPLTVRGDMKNRPGATDASPSRSARTCSYRRATASSKRRGV